MEEKIGVVTDYLNRIGVAVIRLTDRELRVGDQVRNGGRATELTQTVARPPGLAGARSGATRSRSTATTRSSGCAMGEDTVDLSPARGVGRRSLAVARVISCGAMQGLTSATR